MAASAVQSAAVRRKAACGRHEAGKAARKVKRAKPGARRLVTVALLILALAALFAYIDSYANLAATSVEGAKLVSDCKAARIQNERLRVELIIRTSPQNITQKALESGMVYATRYDYLSGPQTVARAGRDR